MRALTPGRLVTYPSSYEQQQSWEETQFLCCLNRASFHDTANFLFIPPEPFVENRHKTDTVLTHGNSDLGTERFLPQQWQDDLSGSLSAALWPWNWLWGWEGHTGGGTPWDALGCLKEKWTYAEDNSWNRCETKYFISQSCPHPLRKGNEIAGLTCSSSDRALFLSKIPWPGQILFPVSPLPTARGGRAQEEEQAFLTLCKHQEHEEWWPERHAWQ